MYDLIIIGTGPAGCTASIYASRYKLSHVVIGQMAGGTIALASHVENFPGFNSISGLELGEKMLEQVKYLGAEVVLKTVGRIEIVSEGPAVAASLVSQRPPAGASPAGSAPPTAGLQGSTRSSADAHPFSYFKVFADDNQVYESKTLIVATGTERRKLNIPGEKEYLGKGVSYCTACDAPFFRDKTVALIGGSDAAVSGAVHVAQFAKQVYIIYRGDSLRAEPIWLGEAKKDPKITTIFKTNLKEIRGDGNKVTGVVLDNPYNGNDLLALDGVFIEIGGVPGTSLLVPLGVEVNGGGYVKVNEWMATGIPGLFAAGDFTTAAQVLQQAITACAHGAIAAAAAFKYLTGQKAPQILG